MKFAMQIIQSKDGKYHATMIRGGKDSWGNFHAPEVVFGIKDGGTFAELADSIESVVGVRIPKRKDMYWNTVHGSKYCFIDATQPNNFGHGCFIPFGALQTDGDRTGGTSF